MPQIMKSLSVLYIMLTILNSCKSATSQQLEFNYCDSAYIELRVLNCQDTAKFSLRTTPLIPMGCINKEIYIVQDGTYHFSHKTIKPDLIDFTLRKRFQTYVVPGDTLKITANLNPNLNDDQSIIIDGVYGKISTFFSKKAEKLGYWDIHSVLSNIINSSYNLDRTFILLDSTFNAESRFLDDFLRTTQLEEWFYQTIMADIEYGRCQWKYNALFNRKYFHHNKDQIDPSSYKILGNENLYNPSAKFSRAYYDCLSSYFMANNEDGLENITGFNRAFPLVERSIDDAKNVIKGDILEFFVGYKISSLLEGSKEVREIEKVDSLLHEIQGLIIHQEINEILHDQREYRSKFLIDKRNSRIQLQL